MAGVKSAQSMPDDEFVTTLRTMKPDATDAEIQEAVALSRQQQEPDNADMDGDIYDGIQPANFIIVDAFNLCLRLWCRAGMDGQLVHLDVAQCEARLNRVTWYRELEPDWQDVIFWGLDVMQDAYLKARQES